MDRLAVTLELATRPSLHLMPLRSDANAFVFGRNGRPAQAMTLGAALKAVQAPAAFDVLAAHELSHAANRDLTIHLVTRSVVHSFFWLIPVELDPGEASIHHLHTPHASGANGTEIRRVNLVVSCIAPEVAPANAADSALMVRGVDEHGHFRAESRLDAEFSPAAVEAHARAMALRRKVFADAASENAP